MADKTIDIEVKINAPTIKDLRNNIQGLEEDIKQATDTKQVKKLENEINNLNKSIKEIQKSGSDLGATFEEMYGDLQPLSTRISEAEDRLYELARAGKVNTDEFRNLSIQVAENKKIIMETDMAIDDMANNRGLASFGSQLGGIGESLMTLDFSRANNQAKAFANNAKTIDFSGAISQVKNLGGTFMQLGKALLTNPLFLIVATIVAIGAVIVKLLDKLGILKVIMDAVGKAFEWVSGLIDLMIQPLKDLTDWLGWTANAATEAAEKQAAAATKAADAQEEAGNRHIQAIDNQIRKMKAEGKDTEALERKKLVVLKNTAIARAQEAQAAVEAAKLKGDLDDKEIADLEKKARLLTDASKQARQEIVLFDIEKNAEKNNKIAADNAKAAADRKAAWEKRKSEIEAQKQFEIKTNQEIIDLKNSLIEDDTERELAINKEKFKRLNDELLANTQYTKEQVTQLKAIYAKQEIKANAEINKKKADDDIAAQKEVDAILFELNATAEEQELANIQAKYDAKKQILIDNATEEYKLTEEYQKALLALQAQSDADMQAYLDEKAKEKKAKDEADLLAKLEKDANTLAGQKALLEEQKRQELENAELTGEERNAIEEKYRKLRLDADIAAAQNGLATASSGLNAIQGLSDAIFANKMSKLEKGSAEELKAAKKQFEINKKLQIAQAIIQGVQATLAAYSSGSAIPVVGAVTGPLFAALAAATSFANIAKIKNSKFEGGGSTASTGSAGAGAAAVESASAAVPSFDFFGSGGSSKVGPTQSVEAGSSQQNQQPIVVSVEEITSTQNRVAKISESGTL